jgi:eukaryotic-like serine/threonine-protein kinase
MAQRSKVGHYDIVEELGRGGMGVVYKGYESSLHRHVAIKMLSESLADDAMVVERFFREARSMAQLNDPHIVQIYMVGEDQGQPFFAMEFVAGESLSQRLKREHLLEPFEAARILLQVAQGLALAHDRGVIHRDIKPANLLITERGVVKVADFGIALASQDFNKKLTGTGQFVGTPGYLSPEVCLGKPVDQRSDLFALGIVFFEMLTGQTPYKDESPLGMMLEVVQAEIPDVRRINDSIDQRFSEILKRMVAKEPADRYPDCHQLIADLVAAGVNAAAPVTPARPVANAVVGTAINVPTPPEIRRMQTPPPVPAPVPVAPAYSTLAVAAAAPVAAAPAPVLPPPRQKPSMLPWAVAVVSLLAAGSGAAWYMGKVPGLPGPNAVATAASVSTASAVADPVVATATTADSATPSGSDPAVSSGVTADPAAASSTGATQDSSAVSASAAVPDSAAVVETAAAASGAGGDTGGDSATRTMAANPAPVVIEDEHAPVVESAQYAAIETAPGPRAGAPTSAPSPQSAAIGARLSDLRETRRERREARAEAESSRPAQYAKANSASVSSAPAYRGPPRVVVLGFGDPAVAGSAEMAIEESLSEAGLELVDEDLISGLSGIEDGSADMARLIAAVARHADYVVAVRVVPMGESPLTFYGETMTQYTARLDVGAYDVQQRRKLGSGWSTQLSFTHLNVDPNTREAIGPYLQRIAQGLGARARG